MRNLSTPCLASMFVHRCLGWLSGLGHFGWQCLWCECLMVFIVWAMNSLFGWLFGKEGFICG